MEAKFAEFFSLLLGASLFGLFSNIHCMGMCGGISQALIFALPSEKRTPSHLLWFQLYYNVGRIFSYILLGAFFGILGANIKNVMGQTVMQGLRFAAACFIILLGLHMLGVFRHFSKIERLGSGVWKALAPYSKKLLPIQTKMAGIGFGMIWGLLPCGLVYAMLTAVLSIGNVITGMLMMLAFGLGTLPAVFLTGSLAGGLSQWLKSRYTKYLMGSLMIGLGIFALLFTLPLEISHKLHHLHGPNPVMKVSFIHTQPHRHTH